jgi:hypothetical protein
MDGTSTGDNSAGLRAARVGAIAQAVMLVVVAVVIVLKTIVFAPPCCTGQETKGCQTCWLVGGSRLSVLLVVPVLMFAFVYAAMATALRHEPRGQWVMLAVTEALLPIVILGVHAAHDSWSFSTRWLLGWVPNLVILVLLATPSALRAAWGRPVA